MANRPNNAGIVTLPGIYEGYTCGFSGTVLHELLHVLGFHHEHKRPDAGEYVKVLWENIAPGESTQQNHDLDRRYLHLGIITKMNKHNMTWLRERSKLHTKSSSSRELPARGQFWHSMECVECLECVTSLVTKVTQRVFCFQTFMSILYCSRHKVLLY